MRTSLILSTVLLSLSGPAAFAASGTPEEQAACRPDVRKFCHTIKESDGDDAFLKCLQSHRDNLSKACLAVLADHGK